MSAPQTVRSATRRLVGLTALRWLPVGLTTPITVLLAQARGLVAELDAVLTRWMDEHPTVAGPETGDLVSVLLDVVPLKEWPS